MSEDEIKRADDQIPDLKPDEGQTEALIPEISYRPEQPTSCCGTRAVRGGKLVRLVLTPRKGVLEKARVVVRAELLEGQQVPVGFVAEKAKPGLVALRQL